MRYSSQHKHDKSSKTGQHKRNSPLWLHRGINWTHCKETREKLVSNHTHTSMGRNGHERRAVRTFIENGTSPCRNKSWYVFSTSYMPLLTGFYKTEGQEFNRIIILHKLRSSTSCAHISSLLLLVWCENRREISTYYVNIIPSSILDHAVLDG